MTLELKICQKNILSFLKTLTYPFTGIIEAERELIKFIDNLAIVKNVEMT